MSQTRAASRRSFTKAITYRVTMIVANAVAVFLLTGNWETTRDVSIVLAVLGTIVYFAHERAWAQVNWGKQAVPSRRRRR